jgi:hypothetical protein
VAPPLYFAQDAVALKLLPETTQEMFLSFALAELYEQVVSFLVALPRWGRSTGLMRPVAGAAGAPQTPSLEKASTTSTRIGS